MTSDHVISANPIVLESLPEDKGNKQELSGKTGSTGNNMIRSHEFRPMARERNKQVLSWPILKLAVILITST